MYPFRSVLTTSHCWACHDIAAGLANQADCLAELTNWHDLQVASARLGLGVTTLKRVCRASNMKRWPFRKRNSLGRLIDRTKQVLDDGTGQDNMQKLAALQVLEKQRQVMRVSFFQHGYFCTSIVIQWQLCFPQMDCQA